MGGWKRGSRGGVYRKRKKVYDGGESEVCRGERGGILREKERGYRGRVGRDFRGGMSRGLMQ